MDNINAWDTNIWLINDLDLVIRLILAVVLGGLVGIEREFSNHAAGFRTHILVCLGSTTIMLLSIYGFSDFVYSYNVRMDPARLAAQVISGIGFLGAGAIMRNGNIIKGLTTAASLWVVAAIGLCIGAGFYKAAVISTLLVLITLFIMNKLEKLLTKKRSSKQISFYIMDNYTEISKLLSLFEYHNIKVINMNVNSENEPEQFEGDKHSYIHLNIACKVPKKMDLWYVLEQIRKDSKILSIKVKGEDTKSFA